MKLFIVVVVVVRFRLQHDKLMNNSK